MNNIDPPLTHLGFSQAQVTGKYLYKLLEEGQYEAIVIETSPFLRTMETAAAIAIELGVPEITVNYRCGEWMKQQIFPDGSPMKSITLSDLETNQISEKFLKSIQIDHKLNYKSELNHRYPESRLDV